MAKSGGSKGGRGGRGGTGGFTEPTDEDMQRDFDRWGNSLTDEELAAINRYEVDYSDINDPLRNGEGVPNNWRDDVRNLDNALNRGRVQQDIIVYRDLRQSPLDNLRPGQTYTEKGYVSTSLDKDLGFVDGRTTSVQIRVPKGAKGGYLPSKSDAKKYVSQKELLLARNTKFRVVSNTVGSNGVRNIVLEVVP